MTEEEAKTKWCPLANAVATVPPAVAPAGNRGVNADASIHPNPPWARCIASACMAWRQHARTFKRETELWSKSKGVRVNSAWADDAEWRSVSPDSDPPPATGYCGLAGSPQ